jgi:hypothetical protein
MAQELALLEWHSPEIPPRLVGFILYDPALGKMQIRMARDFRFLQDEDQRQVLSETETFLLSVIEESGPARCLEFLEENLSNILRLSCRLRLPTCEPDLVGLADALAQLLLNPVGSQ